MVYSCVKEEDSITFIKEEKQSYVSKKRKNHIQMDKILKRLFTLKNSKPIIDFLNSAYKDNISYDAKLYYADREINNFEKKSSRYISFYADMYIKVIDKENIYEYEIEIPKQDIITYSCKVLKYFDYDINKLIIENMYLLLPLQIFKLRKKMYKINVSNLSLEEKKNKMIYVYNELKIIIKDTLKAIDLSYNNNKITLEDYDEMTSAIENINSYFLGMYGKYTDIDEEVREMVKSFYDPKVEERGIEKGKIEGKIETASEMIKEDEPIEKIKKYTKLDENKILELMKKIGNKKVQ